MAYMISGNMDSGAADFQIEAAISKIYASVSDFVLLQFLKRGFLETVVRNAFLRALHYLTYS